MRLLAAATVLALLGGCSAAALPQREQPLFHGSGFAACPTATGASRLPGVGALPCMDGSGSSFAPGAATGVPMVLNLWASWCAQCGKEMPEVAAYAATAKGRVTVLGIDVRDGDSTNAVSAARSVGVKFANIYDKKGKILTSLQITGLPSTVFLTASGQVAYVYRGAPLTRAALADLVEVHLGVQK